MYSTTQESRLSRMHTYWSVLCQAHQGSEQTVFNAQRVLLERYGKAVNRYLLGALRDQAAAEEVAQDFALRFLEGGFRGADQGKGRFRDFVKGVLFRMVADHHRRRVKQHLPMTEQTPVPISADTAQALNERKFIEGWRAELLDRAWKALEQLERTTSQPFYTILRLRAEQPQARSEELARELTAKLGKSVNAAWVRQNLHRARDRFADLLVADVAQTLVNPSEHELDKELMDLGLHDYCQAALRRRDT